MSWDSFFDWLDKWQTLTTGILALGAAFLALRPAYRQIALMRAQNDVMVRSTIGEMILQLDAHRDSVHKSMNKKLEGLKGIINLVTVLGKRYMISELVSEWISDFNKAESALKALFIESHDVEAIEEGKAALLDAVDELLVVLWDIYRPDDERRLPVDYNWNDEQRAAAITRSTEAENELAAVVGGVSTALDQLNEAYANQRDALVRRLRVIDDGLLAK